MIVLDTTVLVYAVGAEHPFREPCRDLVHAVSNGRVEASTTVEVIQEFVHVRSRRRGRGDAVELGSAYAELFTPLLAVTADELREGLGIYRAGDGLGALDAVLAAAALAVSADVLVSADVAFADVPGLCHVAPDKASVAQLLPSC